MVFGINLLDTCPETIYEDVQVDTHTLNMVHQSFNFSYIFIFLLKDL